MPGKHAVLSASASHRWLLCTPSAQLEAVLPDTAGVAAAEGTLAHEIAELKLRKHFTLDIKPRAFTKRLNELKKDPLYQDEMDRHTDAYRDYLSECAMGFASKPATDIEARLDFSSWVPEGFGTGDCIMVGDSTLQITDFKYGKGVEVYAENNSQMMLYALGALARYGWIYPIERIKLVIFQPRRDHISEWETTPEALLQWAEDYLKPRAEMAIKGEGDFCPGEHQCRFCKARGRCKALAQYNLALTAKRDTPPALLADVEIGEVLQRADPFLEWLKAVKNYALQAALDGMQIPGWKVVAGISRRVFTDMDAAFDALRGAGYDDAVLYERKPITLAAAEKLVGKKPFEALCGPYAVKPYGAPTLVPESDQREPYNKAASDFDGLQTDNT